jgi:single-strand DNA-binding protein
MAELSFNGVGVATADPELKFVGQKKTPVCTVNLAFNRSYKDNNDQWQNEPCFMRAQVWSAKATRMSELVKKGQPIYVNGYIKQDSWEDKDSGQKRVAYSLNVRDFQLCVKTAKNSDEAQPAQATKVAEPSAQAPTNDPSVPF